MAQQRIDVILNLFDKFSPKMKNVIGTFDDFQSKVNKRMGQLNFSDKLQQAGLDTQQFENQLMNFQKSLSKIDMRSTAGKSKAIKVQQKYNEFINETAKGLQANIKAEQDSIKSSKSFQKALLGVGLSMLFTGMAIKRVFDTILKSTIATFKEIAGENNVLNQNLTQLSGAWTLLKFSVGEAIAAFVAAHPEIIGMIISFANWVNANKALVGQFVVMGAVFGTVMMVLGQFLLAMLGVSTAVTWIKGAWAGLSALWGAFATGVGGSVIAAIGALAAVIGVVILAIMVLVAMWKSNFAGIRDNVKDTLGIIWQTFKNLFANLKQIFMGIFKVFKGIFTGDFSLVMEGLLDMIVGVVKLILNIIIGLGMAIVNVFVLAINMVSGLFFNLVNLIIGLIKQLFAWINKIPGVNIDFIVDGLDTAIKGVDKFKDSLKIPNFTMDQYKAVGSFLDDVGEKVTGAVVAPSVLAPPSIADNAPTAVNDVGQPMSMLDESQNNFIDMGDTNITIEGTNMSSEELEEVVGGIVDTKNETLMSEIDGYKEANE